MDIATASASWILVLAIMDRIMGSATLTWVADSLGMEDLTHTSTSTVVDKYSITTETQHNLAEDIIPGTVAFFVAAIVYFGSRAVRGYRDGRKK